MKIFIILSLCLFFPLILKLYVRSQQGKKMWMYISIFSTPCVIGIILKIMLPNPHLIVFDYLIAFGVPYLLTWFFGIIPIKRIFQKHNELSIKGIYGSVIKVTLIILLISGTAFSLSNHYLTIHWKESALLVACSCIVQLILILVYPIVLLKIIRTAQKISGTKYLTVKESREIVQQEIKRLEQEETDS